MERRNTCTCTTVTGTPSVPYEPLFDSLELAWLPFWSGRVICCIHVHVVARSSIMCSFILSFRTDRTGIIGSFILSFRGGKCYWPRH